ncbi:hypothetical protein OF83DRAFT_119093 [Amylostereum chailletii]|nr:hypothetical protein OF83DRAFT_119093 [Amylostereum chailletii]
MSKRAAPARGISLVEYPDSDNESDPDKKQELPPKKRKLPALAPHLSIPIPVDDPSKHQGRIRSSPHVDGQWAAHVYISIPLSGYDNKHLDLTLKTAFTLAKERVPALQTVVPSDQAELHISLTRPVFLRAHQRQELKQAIKLAARDHGPFTASFAAFAELTNDEYTRTFLCLEIGAGHHEIRAFSDALSPILRAFRQKEYYATPRFHASFAWALLDPPSMTAGTSGDIAPSYGQNPPTPPPCTPADGLSSQPTNKIPEARLPGPVSPMSPESSTALPGGTTSSHAGYPTPSQIMDLPTVFAPFSRGFPSIPHFPPSLVPELNRTLGNHILDRAAAFDVTEVRIRIGKEISRWKLSG